MFSWFKHKSNPKEVQALPEPDDPVVLHNHDMAKWNYLGYTCCTYVDHTGNLLSEHPVFLFVDKNNDKRRSYFVASENVEKTHPYMNKSVKPWAIGEGEIWDMINHEKNKPSDYLKEYMLDKFSAEWDDDTNWWSTNDKAKYDSAQGKQKREQKSKEVKTVSDGNVVAVDFGKQA